MPSRAKYFRSLEDGNTDVGALVDDLQPPAMVFEEGIDLTEPAAPAPAAPQSFELPPPVEYDAKGDEKVIADATARDRRNELLRGLEMGSKQAIAGITGTPTADAFLTSTNEAGAARAASDKARGRFDDTQKQRRTEMLRAMELGVRAAPKPADPLAERRVKTLEEGVGIRKAETERKTTAEQARRAAIDAAKKAKEEADKKKTANSLDDSSVPYLDGKFVSDTGRPVKVPDSLRAQAGSNATVVSSLLTMEKLLGELVKRPTDRQLRAKVESQAALLAPKINVAQGQGAMAEGEFTRMKQAIGDPGTAGFWLDALKKSDDAALLARAQQAREYFTNDITNAMRGFHLRRDDATAPGANKDARTIVENDKGERRYLNADGSLGEVVK